MGIIITAKDLIKELSQSECVKSVGLITGCFDLLHSGHIDLFRFAKSKVDIVIVGIDTDLSIRKSKGITRPIQSQEIRADILSELASIDYVLLLENENSFESELTDQYHMELINLIRPHYLITNCNVDRHWESKKRRIEAINGQLIQFMGNTENSTSKIIEKIAKVYKEQPMAGDVLYFEEL